MEDLEGRLFGGSLDLVTAALVASGVDSEAKLERYLAKLEGLLQRLGAEIPHQGDREKAQALFSWLWRSKPRRFQLGGSFRLTEVIEAQWDERAEAVGNCLGLALLYNVLAQRLGLRVGAVQLEEAFGRGPHVFSIVYTPLAIIDIENIFPWGFDYEGHLNNLHREMWGDQELVADIYLSRGNQLFEAGDLSGAVAYYDRALRLNPRYRRAYLNRGMALLELEREEEARADLSLEFGNEITKRG